jgi:hypothetical protein
MKLLTFLRPLAIAFFLFFFSLNIVTAQTTAFTYQGRLSDSSMTANGGYDLQFALYDAETGGTQQGVTQTFSGITVSNGGFTVQLDFGSTPFATGADRYLEIRVKQPAQTTYTTLSPRQRITSTPYSIRSLAAGTADTATSATTATNATNAEKLGNIDSSSFVQTNSNQFIRNQTTQQAAEFNVSGTGKANIFEAATQYNINGKRVLSGAGQNNLFVGRNTGGLNTGSSNAFVAFDAGFNNTTGVHNSFFGAAAGFSNTIGNYNSFLGSGAGESNTTGSSNSFIGLLSGYINSTGSNNTTIGYFTNVGSANLTFATALGSNAVVNANDTIVLGKVAGTYGGAARPADTVQIPGNLTVNGTLSANINGSSITNLNASNITTGTLNNARLGIVPIINGGTGSATQNFVDLTTNQTVVGDKTFSNTLSGNTVNSATQYNIRGNRILSSIADGIDLFIGVGAGASQSGVIGGTFVGNYAGSSNTIGAQNAFFGVWAGRNNTQGSANAFFGSLAGVANTTGWYNSFYGYTSGRSNTTGEGNSFYGSDSGRSNTKGFRNSFFGVAAGTENTIGNFNSFFGGWAGYLNMGEHNSFMGDNAGRNNTWGARNSFFGKDAGLSNATGSNNTIIGAFADVGSTNLSYASAIGAGSVVSTSNTVVLGRTADTVVAPNLFRVDTLGADGGTSLCRNSLNQISTCAAANLAENSLIEQNTATANTLREQKAQIQTQQTQIERQQQEINQLKAIVCSIKPVASICEK